MKNIGEFTNIANIDQTLCYLIILVPQLITRNEYRRSKSGVERLHSTVTLTVRVKQTENELSAFHLPPLVIFKNLVKAPSGKYPPGMQVLGFKIGTMKRCKM